MLSVYITPVYSTDDLSKAHLEKAAGNFKEAFTLFNKLAQQGDAESQFITGVMCDNGQGTLKDLKKAFYWYRKSAQQGYSSAQYNTGLMYYSGIGTLKDLKKAAYWFEKAAHENGNVDAEKAWNTYELWKYSD